MNVGKQLLFGVLIGMAISTSVEAQNIGIDTKKIEELTGVKGALNSEEKVFKVSFPRTDVKLSVDGWTMKPFMGLTSWAAFTKGTGSHAMVMGDLVVFEDEVNPVMSAALDNGLEVTALHNHFFFDQPNVYFMHIGGHGSVELAGQGSTNDTRQDQRNPRFQSGAKEGLSRDSHSCRKFN